MPSRIMVVEDEPDIRDLIAITLRNQGHEVIEASCGEEAWTKASELKPQILVLDVFLPDMDGISLCEMFRRLPHTAKVPILMLTAWATSQARTFGIEAGADEYMTKPFSPRELTQRIESLEKKKALAAAWLLSLLDPHQKRRFVHRIQNGAPAQN